MKRTGAKVIERPQAMAKRGVSSPAKAGPRTNDSSRTKADILAVATGEFAEKGLSGARIDEIAERTRTSKRMIYYYFESKEGLYRAVLEDSYRRIRAVEASNSLEHLKPLDALAQHVRLTFDHQQANTDFVRLVMVENIHHGEHIAQLSSAQQSSMGAIDTLRSVVQRCLAAGVVRKDLDATELHMSISALCFFSVSNRYTFSTVFKVDMTSRDAIAARRESVVDMIIRFVAP